VEGLRRKKRLEKYNDYKIALAEIALEKGFVLPDYNAAVTFLIPVSPSWTKKKKKAMHHTIHQNDPDTDNLLKALQDALKTEDCSIAHYSGLAKYWVDYPTGRIEIVVHPGPAPKYIP
jgi:Holliday junction resolvase RusA-like endonuclease